MTSKHLHRSLFFLLSLVFLLAGCSSTKLVTSWSEPAFTGKPLRKLLVIGVMENELQRNVYEDQFVKMLQDHGVTGIAAYSVIRGDDLHYSESDIREAVRQTGADGSVIARLGAIRKEQRYVPPTYEYEPAFGYRRGFYGYYGMSYRYVSTPGYMTTDTIVELETTVFSTATEQMIWAGSTRSINPSSATSVVEKNASLIIKDMKKAGLL